MASVHTISAFESPAARADNCSLRAVLIRSAVDSKETPVPQCNSSISPTNYSL